MQAVDPGAIKPGLLAFFVVAGLGVATFFLLRSMNKQLGKIDFDEGEEAGGQEAEEESREAGGSPAPPVSGSDRPGGARHSNGSGDAVP